jgi:hypothetical protein
VTVLAYDPGGWRPRLLFVASGTLYPRCLVSVGQEHILAEARIDEGEK